MAGHSDSPLRRRSHYDPVCMAALNDRLRAANQEDLTPSRLPGAYLPRSARVAAPGVARACGVYTPPQRPDHLGSGSVNKSSSVITVRSLSDRISCSADNLARWLIGAGRPYRLSRASLA